MLERKLKTVAVLVNSFIFGGHLSQLRALSSEAMFLLVDQQVVLVERVDHEQLKLFSIQMLVSVLFKFASLSTRESDRDLEPGFVILTRS